MYTYLVCDNCNPVSLPIALLDTLAEVSAFTGYSKYWLSKAFSYRGEGQAHIRGFSIYRFLTKEL